MIKPGALVMAVLMTGITAGTYYGLDYAPPELLGTTLGRAPKAGPVPPGNQSVVPAPVTPVAEPQQLAQAEAPMTEQDLAEPPPESATPATEPAPVEPAAASAPAEPTPEPAATPPPAPAPKASAPAKPKAPTKAAPAPRQAEPAEPAKPRPPNADVIKPWWPDPTKMPADQLKLQYAGQVQGEEAIALLFSAPVNLESVKQHASIVDRAGTAVAGQWELGKNPRLAVFRGVKPGRYTVVLKPAIAAAQGFMLGTTLQGPVYIQNP